MSSKPTESTLAVSGAHPGVISRHESDSDVALIVNPSFQFSILSRVGVYGVLSAIYVGAISLATDLMADPHADWQSILIKCLDETVYIVPGLLVVVPLVAVNLLRLTRRYASSIDRLSKEMQLLSAGKSESPLVFDSSDAWPHLAVQFNELREEILDLRQTLLRQSHLSQSPEISQPGSLPKTGIPVSSQEPAVKMVRV